MTIKQVQYQIKMFNYILISSFLLALIVEDGGFPDIAPLSVSDASFVDLSNKKAVFAPFDQESLETHRAKFNLLLRDILIQTRALPQGSYVSIEDNSDYDGISRFGEWSIEDKAE